MMLYLRLFAEFFCTGLFSVGGGLATIPFLQDMGQRTGWFTSHDLANMIAHLGVHSGSHGGEYGHLRRIYLRRYPRQRHRHPGPDHPFHYRHHHCGHRPAPVPGQQIRRRSPFTASAPPPPASSPQRAGVSSPSPCWTSPAGRRTASCSPCSTGAVCWWRRQSWCSPDQAHQKIASRPLDSPLRRGRRPVPALSTAVTKQQSVQFLYRS